MFDKSNQIGRTCVCLILLCCSHNGLVAEEHADATTLASNSTVRATHVMGFEGIANNAKGTLSVQDDVLRFQKANGSSVQIPIDSIRSFAAGQQDKQVGGAPMALTKAATPFGSGRLISLLSHKKYDTATLEYLDSEGGVHGAIFLLKNGQSEVLRSELEANGLPADRFGNDSTKAGAQEDK